MTVAEAMQKMILLSDANFHDINHFLKVHAYALTIGACEGLSPAQRYTLELAAIVHDIACPLCREKYGNTNGKYQEQEGAPLTRAFFEGTNGFPMTCGGWTMITSTESCKVTGSLKCRK